MNIQFKLKDFEGPLDLLLHLIAKHKMNIHDIPILLLVEQYLDYISDMAEQDMEVAGEFLEMAARLIYIKTVSLLPKQEEAQTLKKELEGRLIEYSLCKLAAENMKGIYLGDAYTVRKPMKIEADCTYNRQHDPSELIAAYKGMEVKKEKKPAELKPSAFSKLVSKKFVSVTSKIIIVLKKLYRDGRCTMEGLFSELTDRSERVATFLAVLELTKSGRILLNDDNTEMAFNKAQQGSEMSAEEFTSEYEKEADKNEADENGSST